MDQQTAFNRAWEVLNNYRPAKWTALGAGAIAAVFTVVLLGFLGLFVDLLVSKGRIPVYHELTQVQREAVGENWQGIPAERRTAVLEAVGVPAARVGDVSQGLNALPVQAREQVWQACFWNYLDSHISADAAEIYAERAHTAELSHGTGLGLLSLVARTQESAVGRFFCWLARWNPWMWRPDDRFTPNFWYLTGLLVYALAAALVRAGLVNVMNYSAAISAVAVSTRLRRAVYHHTYRLGTLTIRRTGTSEAVNVFSHHIEAIQDAIQARLTTQFFGPLQVGLLLAFALAIHFWLGTAFLLAAAIVLLVGGQLAASHRRTARVAERRADARRALLRESLLLMRLVKSNSMETFNQSRVERQLAEYATARLSRAKGDALMRPLFWFLGTLATTILLYVAGLIVLSGGLGTAGAIVLAATLVSAYWPIRSWLSRRRLVRHGQESAVAVYEFLDRPREVGQVVGAEFLPAIAKGVEFRGVSLREPTSGRMLLDDVNLKINAGERVGLAGSDETEKHAVVYLLARFLDPSSGEVRIDDKLLKWLTLDSLRAQIGLILQPDLIFNDTVANNISCGDPTYAIPQIIEAAKTAHAHHFIQKLPYGYETPIGEMGSSLRIGEQFRVALARAILRDPAMFVIEEPTTAFDDETKSLLDDTFARILPGKTVLFLPHRISTIRSCDRLYLIHRGRVEAIGQHRELITRNELYKHLHYMEFNEFAEHV